MGEILQFLRNSEAPDLPAGGSAFLPSSLHQLPRTIPAGGQVQSALILNGGLLHVAVTVQSTENGVLSLQRYLDTGGIVTVQGVVSANLSAKTPAIVESNDAFAWSCVVITATNTGGADAILSNVTIMLLSK